MGVSLDIYRQNIGIHNLKWRGQRSTVLSSDQEMTYLRISRRIFLYFSLCLMLNSAILLTSQQKHSYKLEQNLHLPTNSMKIPSILPQSSQSNQSSKNQLQFDRSSINQSQINPSSKNCINWDSGLSNNKRSHILYGNRRNLGYKYFSWNCDRGLLAKHKIEDVRVFAARHKPHFMGISEVDLKRNENNPKHSSNNEFSTEKAQEALKIDGYRLLFPSSWMTHDKARIIVYVHDEIKAKVINDDPAETHLQHVLLEVGFGRSKTHFVDFYYREWKSCVTGESNSAAQNRNFELLTNIWRKHSSQDKDFLSLGDSNICAKKMDDPSYIHRELADTFQDFLIEENCYQIVDEYTRIRMVNNTVQRSCLDHISVNCIDKVRKPEVLGIGQSDHLGILVTKKTRELRTCARTVKKRVYKNFDRNEFLNEIKKAKASGSFDSIHTCDDVEVAAKVFTDVFTEILDKHAPLKIIQNRCNYVPYINKDLQNLMKERDLLKKSAASSGDPKVYEFYKKARNEVSTKLKTAKGDYYRSKFNENSEDSKTLWSTAYQVLAKNRSDFPSQMLFGSTLLSKPIAIAEAMNLFFVDKISKLKDVPKNNGEPLTELKRFLAKKKLPDEGFCFKELNENEILKLIKRLKGKKSCGLDWICGFSLKVAALELKQELKTLVNLSLLHGRFFSGWKKTKVLPGFKNKGSKFDAKFYRPISNLSEVSKIVEMAAHDQLYEYLCQHSLLHPDHHGFLKHRSTTTALQQLMDIWLKAAEEGKLSAALLLDLSAGFDVIDHQILLAKLKEYGFSDLAAAWFEDYLADRQQSVQIESKFSSFLQVHWGVPQGSILGPLLFVIFINELPESIKILNSDQDIPNNENDDGHIVIYADDNTPTTSAVQPVLLLEKIQLIADRVTDWFSRNEIVVSGEKTKLLILGTQMNRSIKIENPDHDVSIRVCGELVTASRSEKLLGLVINDTMTWKNHLYGDEENEGLMKILAKRVGMLKKLRRYMSPQVFKQALSGLFTSKLIYGISVWTGAWGTPGQTSEDTKTSISKRDMNRLQTLQNKALRIVNFENRSTPTVKLLKSTGNISVHQLGAYHTLNQIYKIRKSEQPEYHFGRLFGENDQNFRYRSSDFLANRINFKLCLSRGSFFYQGCRLWTSLPGNIKCLTKEDTFKKKCKQWVIDNIKIKP